MPTINLPVLENIHIAAPCSVKWEDMQGSDRVRHCAQCSLNVFNLSDMTRVEAESLIQSATGRLCVGYYQRSDGTILTRDCPVGLAALRAKFTRVTLRVGAIAASLLAAIVLGRSRSDWDRANQLISQDPFASIASLLGKAPVQTRFVAGDMCIMPPVAPTPTPPPQLVTPPQN